MTTKLVRIALAALLALPAALYAVQGYAQAGAKPGVYADEDRDWGVPPATQLRTVGYHEPTPTRIPGGKVVTTAELKALLEQPSRPYIIDVLGGGVHRTIAGAFWMIGAGAGDMDRDEEKRFAGAIAGFAAGDKSRPMAFFCVDSECWLSYNAALRTIALGYTNVMWYRGGIASWRTSEGLMTQSDPFFW
jgi:PQQ-dependent catabolism-associated CXXCW motif protein